MDQNDLYRKIPIVFYQSNDVVTVARKLLGCRLWSRVNNRVTAGVIVETEAYDGLSDRASHAFGGKRTPRTSVFYQAGGVTYTYLCYGIHTLFNIITGSEEVPHAVLIRALSPCEGMETMLERRKQTRLTRKTTGGPGMVSQALGITRAHNGIPLNGEVIWASPGRTSEVPDSADILASPRVGVGYAGVDASLPWRFRIRSSPWTSPAK
ncbi:MAG: DNA-3-methyladenine glycosylase [Balneolales bacterium]